MAQSMIVFAFTGLAAAIHFVFAVLEIGAWSWTARRLLRFDDQMAAKTRALGINQGVYNLFLSAGLALTLIRPEGLEPMRMFLLGCCVVAGLIGQLTIGRAQLFLGAQATPAMLALIAASPALQG